MLILPINSMVIGKSGGGGDRQTFGIGADGDSLPMLSAAHHHAVACLVGHGGGFGMKRQSIRQSVNPVMRSSGVSSYNLALTGPCAMTVLGSKSDKEHIPLVLVHETNPSHRIGISVIRRNGKEHGMAHAPAPHPRIVGLDSYNSQLTGQVAKCISSRASDSDHIPLCVVYDPSKRSKIVFQEESDNNDHASA